jgi:hypothetical protein
MERPTGVTILAVLQFIGAGIFILCGLGMMLMGAGMSAAGKGGSGAAALIMGMGVVGAIVFFVFGAIYFAIGYGLWTLKNWARVICLVFIVLGLISGIPGAFSAIFHFNIGQLVGVVIQFGIGGWILMYLIDPKVKRAFGTV